MNSMTPDDRLSTTETLSPLATRRSIKWEPMNQAPPVTSARMCGRHHHFILMLSITV